MADPRFFARRSPLTLGEIARLSGAILRDPADSAHVVEDVAPLDAATDKTVSFLDNVKYKEQFLASKAGACFVSEKVVSLAPAGMRLLVSSSPYKSYALTAQAFYPEPIPDAGISPHAVIDPSAQLGAGCQIDAGVVIGPGVKIGRQCLIEANAVIGAHVEIGDHCRIGAGASLSHTLIGSHVRLYPGVRVGQDGFGFAIDSKGHVKVPQLGRVIVEDHVEIGANTTIDRGAGPDTVIGQGTWIDNLVQIGHNVRIGRGCIIVAQTGISGSTIIEDFVAMGGQSGAAGHLRIGKGARVAAQSGLMRDVGPGEEVMGYPAVPIKQFMRQVATLNRLIKRNKNA